MGSIAVQGVKPYGRRGKRSADCFVVPPHIFFVCCIFSAQSRHYAQSLRRFATVAARASDVASDSEANPFFFDVDPCSIAGDEQAAGKRCMKHAVFAADSSVPVIKHRCTVCMLYNSAVPLVVFGAQMERT